MADSVLAVGEKLHIMTRRLFADDAHPHFVGEVSAVAGSLFKADGYAFVFDSGTNSYLKHPQIRTRLFSLSDAAALRSLIAAVSPLKSTSSVSQTSLPPYKQPWFNRQARAPQRRHPPTRIVVASCAAAA
jgi:hypothetical protein